MLHFTLFKNNISYIIYQIKLFSSN